MTLYSAHGFSGSGIRTEHSGMTSLCSMTYVWPSARECKGWDRNHLKAHPLVSLVVDARYQLGASVSLRMSLSIWWASLGFLRAWWLGSKGEHPVKERTRKKLNNLESHAVVLPLHSVIKAITQPCPNPGGGDVDFHLSVNMCQC